MAVMGHRGRHRGPWQPPSGPGVHPLFQGLVFRRHPSRGGGGSRQQLLVPGHKAGQVIVGIDIGHLPRDLAQGLLHGGGRALARPSTKSWATRCPRARAVALISPKVWRSPGALAISSPLNAKHRARKPHRAGRVRSFRHSQPTRFHGLPLPIDGQEGILQGGLCWHATFRRPVTKYPQEGPLGPLPFTEEGLSVRQGRPRR